MSKVKIKATELRDGDLWTDADNGERWVLTGIEIKGDEVEALGDSIDHACAAGFGFSPGEVVEVAEPRPGPVTDDSATRQPLARVRDELIVTRKVVEDLYAIFADMPSDPSEVLGAELYGRVAATLGWEDAS